MTPFPCIYNIDSTNWTMWRGEGDVLQDSLQFKGNLREVIGAAYDQDILYMSVSSKS